MYHGSAWRTTFRSKDEAGVLSGRRFKKGKEGGENMKYFAIVLMMVVMGWFSMGCPSAFAATDSDLTDGRATLTQSTGDVKVWKDYRREWRSGRAGMELEGGDRIVTGPESTAVVSFDRGGKNTTHVT